MRVWIPVEIVPLSPAYAPPPRRPWIGMGDIAGGLIGLLLLAGFFALLLESL